jgi:glycosyltransferase involved in cell wall biosynthesis
MLNISSQTESIPSTLQLSVPTLSVIVTSYALYRFKEVTTLLNSLKNQSYPILEIIFVGENSRELCDKVRNYARASSMANVIVFFNNGEPGASVARNIGIEHAQGDVIAFLDDCTVAMPNWAKEMTGVYAENEHIIGVAGAAEPMWEDPALDWFPIELYWLVSCTSWMGLKEKTKTCQGASVNLSYRREAFQKAGLFSRSLGPKRSTNGRIPRWREGPEDNELSRRIVKITHGHIIFNPEARVYRKVCNYQLSLNFIAKRARATGWSAHLLYHFYKGEDTGTLQSDLLRRIILSLLPNIARRSFRQPRIAWRQLTATFVTVICFAVGYFSFPIYNHSKPLAAEKTSYV